MPDHQMLNPMQVESEIVRLSDLLEDRASDFTVAIRAAAEAEANWKRDYAIAMIQVIESATGTRMTVAEREARVEIMTTDQHRTYLITSATAKSVKESLSALDSQINALRTLAANHRAMS
ncbi:MAG: hypothetical protein MUP76_04590 [Acidimicrobiia bacterium]|nr:hypothetical protein [Acidimicrobiia bacterium]